MNLHPKAGSPSNLRRSLVSVWVCCLILLANANAVNAQTASGQIASHQQLAQQAETRGDFDTAVREYEAIVKLLPGNAEAESNLGVAYYFDRDFAQAASCLRRALRSKPSLYAPHLFLGLVEFQISQPDSAAVELQQAVKMNGADPLAHAWLGYAFLAESRYLLAAQQLETANSQQPANTDVDYALGRCYLALGKAAAIQLVTTAPDGGRTWQLAAEQAERQENQTKALSMYKEAYLRRPDLQDVRDKIQMLKGTVPERSNKATPPIDGEDSIYASVIKYEQQAKAAFERISQIDPNSFRIHQILGDSLVAADRLDEAVVEYKMVLEKKSDLPGIHEALCNALSRTARMAEAVTECEAELKISPYSAEAAVQAARVYLLADQNGKAESLLNKAMTLNEPPIGAYKYLGQVRLNQKKYQEAALDLKKYLSVEHTDSNAWYLLSRAYKYQGDTELMKQAIESYKKSLVAANDAQKALAERRDQELVPNQVGLP